MPLKIGALAQRTGTNAPTIRYYEEIGLLPRPGRQNSGQRVYGDDDALRVTFIRRCRDFGFSIAQIRTLVALMHDDKRSCVEARDLANEHLKLIRAKLAELRELEKSIAGFVVGCETSCIGGPGRACVVLEDLASSGR